MIEQKVSGIVDGMKMNGNEIASRLGVNVNKKLFALMSDNIYSNVPNAIVRELTSNAIDASVKSGTNEAVVVHIPTNLNQDFYVQDFGSGMSIETLIHHFASYFSSTKENDETQIGGFGLGSKTPFAYVEEKGFRVESTSPDDGVRRTLIFKRIEDEVGDKYPTFHHIDDLDVKNSSVKGTKISFELKSEADIERFLLACVPLLYSAHPIDFQGYDIRSYFGKKFNQKTHDELLMTLKNEGMIFLNSKKSENVHLNFNLSNLTIKNGEMKSDSVVHCYNLHNVLNLRLGSVIYQVKMKGKKTGELNEKLWYYLTTLMNKTNCCLFMIDVQENGYIALDVSRESIRETELNKKNLLELLVKASFNAVHHSFIFMENEFFTYFKENLKNKNVYPCLNNIHALKALLKFVKEFVTLLEEINQSQEVQVHEKIKEIEVKIDEANESLEKELDGVFFLNFEEKPIDGKTFLSLLNGKQPNIYVKSKFWNELKNNESLKSLFLSQNKNKNFISVKNSLHSSWQNTVDYFETLHNENEKLLEIKDNVADKNEMWISLKDETKRNEYFKTEINRKTYYKAYHCKDCFTIPTEYKIKDINKLTNMDKAMLLVYDFFGQSFGFDVSKKCEKNMSLNDKEELKHIKKLNKDIIYLFNMESFEKDIYLTNVCFISYKEYEAVKPFHFLREFLNYIIHAKAHYHKSSQKNVGKTIEFYKILPKNYNTENVKFLNIDEAKDKIIDFLDFAAKSNRDNQNGSYSMKKIVFGDNDYADEVIFNYFDKKYGLMKMAESYCTDRSLSVDAESLKNNLNNNIELYKQTGLDNFFKDYYSVTFYYNKNDDLTEIQKTLFNILAKINSLVEKTKKTKSEVSFDTTSVECNLVWKEIETPKPIKDIQELKQPICKMFEAEIPNVDFPKDKAFATYLKIAQEINK